MQKLNFFLISFFLLLMTTGCQTIKDKTDAIIEKENQKLSNYISKPASVLQMELGKPDEDFKNAKGNYEFRFRKKSAIEAKRKKMAIDYVDRDGDGKVTFEEILIVVGEEITEDEEEKLRLKFERLDADKDGFVNAEDALNAFNQEQLVCKVCSKKFEAEMGTKEYDFEICGETEDCKNELWKL